MSRVCKQGHAIIEDNAKPYQKYGKTQYSCRKCSVETSRRQREKHGIFLPPETESVMASYKEPLKSVAQGFGYYGTIAYDKTKQYTQCHMCGNFYKTLGTHVSKVHGKSPKQYKLEFGLPTTLSLSAPEYKSKNHEQWMNMSPEERKKSIGRMLAARDKRDRNMPKKFRTKSLYQRNLEGRCPDQLLDKIMKLNDKLGYSPSRREFNREYGGNHAQSVELTFGSWGEAIKILNLTPRTGGVHPSLRYDKETLLTMLFDFRDKYSREPMSSDTQRGLLPSRQTYANHFGSWSKAKEYVS